jgi:hypothetical protein
VRTSRWGRRLVSVSVNGRGDGCVFRSTDPCTQGLLARLIGEQAIPDVVGQPRLAMFRAVDEMDQVLDQ